MNTTVTTYRPNDGLIGMSASRRATLIDDLLNLLVEIDYDEARREMLVDHELLAAHADWLARGKRRRLQFDELGNTFVALWNGQRAYDPDEYFEYFKSEPKRLTRLTALVRDVLFQRFTEDVAEWLPRA